MGQWSLLKKKLITELKLIDDVHAKLRLHEDFSEKVEYELLKVRDDIISSMFCNLEELDDDSYEQIAMLPLD